MASSSFLVFRPLTITAHDFLSTFAVSRRSQSRRTDYDSLEKCNFVGFSACRCANVCQCSHDWGPRI